MVNVGGAISQKLAALFVQNSVNPAVVAIRAESSPAKIAFSRFDLLW